MLQWTLRYTCLFWFWFPQCVCPEVGLLGHKAGLFPETVYFKHSNLGLYIGRFFLFQFSVSRQGVQAWPPLVGRSWYKVNRSHLFYQTVLFYLWTWKWKRLSRVRLFATLQSMGFSRPEYFWPFFSFPRDPTQGIFPSQGSNRCLPHCWRILYQLSHQGSPL